MARKTSNLFAKQQDDSWLADVADIITKPTHRVKLFVDVKKCGKTLVKIVYDDLKAEEMIIDEYESVPKARAFYESLDAFIRELKHGTKLEVVQTNVPYLFDEMQTDHRQQPRYVRQLSKERSIKFIFNNKKTHKKGSK